MIYLTTIHPLPTASTRDITWTTPKRPATALVPSPTYQAAAIMADVDLDKHFDLKSLGIEDADDSIEVGVPDFHFDWSKIEGKVKNIADDQPLTSLQRNASPDVAVALMATPPPASASAHSSTSSNHILTLTDASTVSASSLVPTPPEPASINHYGRAGGAVSHEKSSSRTYGGRTFQRVVSAPMASRPLPEQGNELEQDVSLST